MDRGGRSCLFFLSSLLIVIFGWVQLRSPAVEASVGKRRQVIAAGLLAALIAAVCQVGVVLYLKKEHLVYWEESMVASRWGRFNWPLSVLAVLCAVAGKGRGRWLLLISSLWLVVIWTTSFLQ